MPMVGYNRKISYLPIFFFFLVVILVLTLPISTTTTERAFSDMNIVKTRLRNKIEDEFLTNSLMLYIEREISAIFSTDSIKDDFHDMKK
jgi:hypothetical protein